MRPYSATDFQADMQGPNPRMEELAYLQERLGAASALITQSQPLTGMVLTEQGPMDVADAMVAFGVETAVFRFGTWVVTEDGIACLAHHYPLSHARLQEHQDWAGHLAEQPWVNLWDLLRALEVARHMGSHGQHHGPSGDGSHPS